jgi:tetratricopeptide (TPR) repeat protein
MYRTLHRSLALVIVVSCHSAPPAVATGKVPLTTRSAEARALYLQGRALNENLLPHEGHAAFVRAAALDTSFAMAEYGLASTAPDARSLVEHTARAVALAAGASDGERLMILALRARTNAAPARAHALAESLVTRYPADERAHWILANSLLAQQHYGDAIREYRRAIEINPQYSLAYNSLGYAYRPAGENAAAEAAFKQYIALVPNDPNPYDSYAELLMKTGRFDESIVQYRKALAIDPHFGGSFVGISSDHMFAGRYDAAIAEARAYSAAARNDAERRTALLQLALIHVDAGETEPALRAIEQSYRVAAAAGDSLSMSGDLVTSADIRLATGDVLTARELYGRAVDVVRRSALPAGIKDDISLAHYYNSARAALAAHDASNAHANADAYLSGTETRHNSVRLRQAHELNGLVALNDRMFDIAVREFALADQQNPAVVYGAAQAWRGKGDITRATKLTTDAVTMYILPTLPYVLLRAHVKHGERP